MGRRNWQEVQTHQTEGAEEDGTEEQGRRVSLHRTEEEKEMRVLGADLGFILEKSGE